MAEEEKPKKPKTPYEIMGELLKPKPAAKEEEASSSPGPYQYARLPEICYCHTPSCGYSLKNPGKHCRELRCPKCGARLWRVPP